MTSIRYSTSLRAASTEETLARAKREAARFGITRVTDVTRLDRIGIPVFVSIRPNATAGSLCVNAGKGMTTEEARIGAWMECIEYAIAEPGVVPLEIVPIRARDVLDGRIDPPAILDLCPMLGKPIPLDEPIPCVLAEEILSGTSCYVPAELVFLPAPSVCTQQYFGASSNGLASGNTVLEATLHGVAELLERDIKAFFFLRDTSELVQPESYPETAQGLVEGIEAAGLHLFVRYQANDFDLPFFRATIVDPLHPTPLFIHGGYGCHPHRAIAFQRAVCEAAQSRLSFIHGGRDDLTDWHERIQSLDEEQKLARKNELFESISNPARVIDFTEIPDYSAQANTIEACFDLLTTALNRAGLHRICRVAFTRPEDELQVVRVIVPLLEEFDVFSSRVGQRLANYAES